MARYTPSRMSKGEKAIYGFLLKAVGRNHFICQAARRIVVPFYKGTVFFDFFVPPNTYIEFDGTQHEQFNKHFHRTFGTFGKQKLRDRAKDLWCQKHGFHLIRCHNMKEFREQWRALNGQT